MRPVVEEFKCTSLELQPLTNDCYMNRAGYSSLLDGVMTRNA